MRMKVALTGEQRAAMQELGKFRSFVEAQYLKAQEGFRYAMQMSEFHIQGRMTELKAELGIPEQVPVTFHWSDFSFEVAEETDGGSTHHAESI